jgi:hypothetical protein
MSLVLCGFAFFDSREPETAPGPFFPPGGILVKLRFGQKSGAFYAATAKAAPSFVRTGDRMLPPPLETVATGNTSVNMA